MKQLRVRTINRETETYITVYECRMTEQYSLKNNASE